MRLKFAFNPDKALEALAYVAHTKPGLTPLFVAKIFFFAEKWHLNRYGRPIIGDTYIAMRMGPVPSTIKDFIDQKWNWVGKPDGFDDVVKLDNQQALTKLYPGQRRPEFKLLSRSDIQCLKEAIEFCSNKSAIELSETTHEERAWLDADEDRPMRYDLLIDEGEQRQEILDAAVQFAARGVL
jgi:uncharacterized phage-associated protein